MGKIQPTKPIVVLLYGMPGAGKTFFARQLCETFQAAHLEADRIRSELFEKPEFSRQENHIVMSLMSYMTGEFLASGVSVVFDLNSARAAQRRAIRNLAVKHKAETVLVWFQIDPETAFRRAAQRDRRKSDDRHSAEMNPEKFREQLAGMQNPDGAEKFIVVSGKHVFKMQSNAFIRELKQRRLLAAPVGSEHFSKPGLVNLVPNPSAGRVDLSRRNINVR